MARSTTEIVLAVYDGSLRQELVDHRIALNTQSADISSAIDAASKLDDPDRASALNDLDSAWSKNQEAKALLQQAIDGHNNIADWMNTYTNFYGGRHVPFAGMGGLGFVPAIVALPAVVQAALAAAVLATVVITVTSIMNNLPAVINAAANFADKAGGVIESTFGPGGIPGAAEKLSDTFTKIAVVAAVGAVGYFVFQNLRKKGRI